MRSSYQCLAVGACVFFLYLLVKRMTGLDQASSKVNIPARENVLDPAMPGHQPIKTDRLPDVPTLSPVVQPTSGLPLQPTSEPASELGDDHVQHSRHVVGETQQKSLESRGPISNEAEIPFVLESGQHWPKFTKEARKPLPHPCPGRTFKGPVVEGGPLRFFIYPLPADLIGENAIEQLDKTTRMNRAFEPAIHKVLANHPARTQNPAEASFFVIPSQLSCIANVWMYRGGQGTCGPCAKVENQIIQFMNKFGNYWKRNGGIDHVVSSWKCPASYDKTLYPKLWFRSGPEHISCGPIELCLRTKLREVVFRSVKIPYHVPDSAYADLSGADSSRKDISVFFAGSYLAITGNKRQPIVDAIPRIPRGVSYVFKREQFNKWKAADQSKMLKEMSQNYSRALFIAIPQGDTTIESRRTYQAIAAGCIPISLTEKFVPNLPEALDWSKFAVSFDMDVLFEKQEKIPAEKSLSKKEYNLRHDKRVQERVDSFVKGMTSVTPAQIAHLRAGVAANRELLRYGDDGKGGLGTSIVKALERRREAFKQH